MLKLVPQKLIFPYCLPSLCPISKRYPHTQSSNPHPQPQPNPAVCASLTAGSLWLCPCVQAECPKGELCPGVHPSHSPGKSKRGSGPGVPLNSKSVFLNLPLHRRMGRGEGKKRKGKQQNISMPDLLPVCLPLYKNRPSQLPQALWG